jgi:hypothetical protein
MIGTEGQRELAGLRAVPMDLAEHGCEHVTRKVRWHMASGFVLGDGAEFLPFQPVQKIVV